MDNLIVKSVGLFGDTVMAAQDNAGNIWVGVRWICKGLGMTEGHMKRQIANIKKDLTLARGGSNLLLNKGSGEREVFCLKLDYVPLWLAKVNITPTIQAERPELADKLLEYQLKAKDILAAAFLPKQDATPLTLQQQIQTIAKGTAELYEKVAAIDAKAESVKDELEAFKQELPLFPEDADEVRAALNKKVVDYLGGDSNAYHDRGLRQKAFIDAYRELKRNFGVSTYKSIKRNQKKRALEVIEAYKPPVILLDEIQMVNSQISLDLEGGASRC